MQEKARDAYYGVREGDEKAFIELRSKSRRSSELNEASRSSNVLTPWFAIW